jgi:hypothetical protein
MLNFCIITNWDILLESPLYVDVLWAQYWVLHMIQHCARHMSDLWYVGLCSTACVWLIVAAAIVSDCEGYCSERCVQWHFVFGRIWLFSRNSLCLMTAVFHIQVLINTKSTTLMLLSGVAAGAEIQRFWVQQLNNTTAIIISLCQFRSSQKTDWSPE